MKSVIPISGSTYSIDILRNAFETAFEGLIHFTLTENSFKIMKNENKKSF